MYLYSKTELAQKSLGSFTQQCEQAQWPTGRIRQPQPKCTLERSLTALLWDKLAVPRDLHGLAQHQAVGVNPRRVLACCQISCRIVAEAGNV